MFFSLFRMFAVRAIALGLSLCDSTMLCGKATWQRAAHVLFCHAIGVGGHISLA